MLLRLNIICLSLKYVIDVRESRLVVHLLFDVIHVRHQPCNTRKRLRPEWTELNPYEQTKKPTKLLLSAGKYFCFISLFKTTVSACMFFVECTLTLSWRHMCDPTETQSDSCFMYVLLGRHHKHDFRGKCNSTVNASGFPVITEVPRTATPYQSFFRAENISQRSPLSKSTVLAMALIVEDNVVTWMWLRRNRSDSCFSRCNKPVPTWFLNSLFDSSKWFKILRDS